MKQHEYYFYITTNPNRTVLYIGITNNIGRRLVEHYANRGKKDTFAGRYYCYCLVYLEIYQYIDSAIDRETEVKDWRRELKENLIQEFNPIWKFLNAEWCGEWPPKEIWGDFYQSLRNPPPT
jgi:putative endonuclease